jgi:subtilisin family serine protease
MRTVQPSNASLIVTRLLLLLAGAVALACVASCSRAPLTSPVARAGDRGVSPTSIDDDGYVVTISLARDADPGQVARDNGAALVASAEGFAVLRFPSLELPDKCEGRLLADSRVLTTEPNAYLEPAETRQRSFSFDDGNGSPMTYVGQPAADLVEVNGGHAANLGENVKIAILDTGVDPKHPMIASAIVGGYDFIDNDPDFNDTRDGLDNDGDGFVDEAWGHGTHIAGIVTLIAPRAKLLIVRVLDADGRGDVHSVAAGIRWATEHGANVINMSLGMLQMSPAIKNALDEAEAHGVVCVAAAGNRGAEQPAEFPGCYPTVAAVAAVDNHNVPADFTSFAPYVALSAPGVNVRSAFPGGGYRMWSGTSMSCAFVSGAAALVLAAHSGWHRTQVIERLQAFVRPITNLNPLLVGKVGTGTVDVASAMRLDLPIGLDPNGTLQNQHR